MKMKIFKKWMSIGCCLLMAGSLAACGGNTDSGDADSSNNTNENVDIADKENEEPKENNNSGDKPQIEFWNMVWGNEESNAIGERMCAEYSEANNVEVVYRAVPWTNFYQTFLTAVAAGEAPDCSSGSSYMPFQLYDMGAILPIDDLVQTMYDEGEMDDYISLDLVENYKYDGHYVALPNGIDLRVMYCRADILAENGLEVPTNWDEFRHCLEVLSNPAENKYGMALSCNGDNGKVMFQWIINNGGGLFDEDGNPDCLQEKNVQAVNYLLELINDGLINPSSPGMTADDCKNAFAQGEIAFLFEGPGFADSLPEMGDKIQAMTPMTGLSGESAAVFWNGGLMAYTQTEYPEETKAFMRWFIANMKEYCIDGAYSQLPVRQSILDDPFYAENVVTQKVLSDYVPVMTTIATHSKSLFSQLSAVESDGTLDAVAQSLFTPGITAEELLQTEQKNLENILGM